MEVIKLEDKFKEINNYWNPKIVGEVNDSFVKIAKFKNKFIWHTHENEDEMFYVIKGVLIIKFRDKEVTLKEHEFIIVPKGVEHMPFAENEAHVMMIEAKSTISTGNIVNEKTIVE